MSNWISAKTPPDSDREVLVFTLGGYYWTARYQSGCWIAIGGHVFELYRVTHWCGLPRPPRRSK